MSTYGVTSHRSFGYLWKKNVPLHDVIGGASLLFSIKYMYKAISWLNEFLYESPILVVIIEFVINSCQYFVIVIISWNSLSQVSGLLANQTCLYLAIII